MDSKIVVGFLWVFLALSLGCASGPYIEHITRFKTTVLNEGAVASSGPPASTGDLRPAGHVVLQGSYEETRSLAKNSGNRQSGMSGNNLVDRHIHGFLGYTTSKEIELGLSGRFAGSSWSRTAMASDNTNTLKHNLFGMGFHIGGRIGRLGPLTFDWALELEIQSVPYRRFRKTKIVDEFYDSDYCDGTTEDHYWMEELEDWNTELECDGDLVGTIKHPIETKQSFGAKAAFLPRGDLIVGYHLDSTMFFIGSGYKLNPSINGSQYIETFDYRPGDDEMTVVFYKQILPFYAGAEWDVSEWLSLVAVVYGTAQLKDEPSEPNVESGLNTLGGMLSLRASFDTGGLRKTPKRQAQRR